jgi:polyisoprenoid-binding protein YceI
MAASAAGRAGHARIESRGPLFSGGMKRIFLFLALSWTTALAAAPAVWTVDSAKTRLDFAVQHMMIANVNGTFHRLSGTVTGDPADPLSARLDITIDPSSIDTGLQDRDTHLRTGDFFDVPKFPTARYISRRVVRGPDGKLSVIGDLTLRGVTREVPLTIESVSAPVSDRHGVHVTVRASGTMNRKDFGIQWNRAIEGGGVLVGSDVSLQISLALVRPR